MASIHNIPQPAAVLGDTSLRSTARAPSSRLPASAGTPVACRRQFLGSRPSRLARGPGSRGQPRRARGSSPRATQERGGMGGSMSEDFNEHDSAFVGASLLPATEVKIGSGGFLVTMADGSMLRCLHNATSGTRLPEYPAQPAMVLKLEDGSDILLALIVLEYPRTTLLEAMKNVPLSRPTVYVVIRDMVELMGYEVRLVRITHRVCEAYYARVYLSKVGDKTGAVLSFDLRPSDAINLAIRSKVPIQVSKALAVGDGVRQVSMVPRGSLLRSGSAVRAVRSYHFTRTEQDRPDIADLETTSEFGMVQLMHQAAQEERFDDAAKIRDRLKKIRNKTPTQQE